MLLCLYNLQYNFMDMDIKHKSIGLNAITFIKKQYLINQFLYKHTFYFFKCMSFLNINMETKTSFLNNNILMSYCLINNLMRYFIFYSIKL